MQRAVLAVTGWTWSDGTRHLLGGIPVANLLPRLQNRRVTARLYPKTSRRGVLAGPQQCGTIRPVRAGESNTQTFEVVGRLTRIEPADQLIAVQIYPAVSGAFPFRLAVRATTHLLRGIDPAWGAIRLTGSLIDNLLVADAAQEISAPVPSRWQHWVRGQPPRNETSKVAQEAKRIHHPSSAAPVLVRGQPLDQSDELSQDPQPEHEMQRHEPAPRGLGREPSTEHPF